MKCRTADSLGTCSGPRRVRRGFQLGHAHSPAKSTATLEHSSADGPERDQTHHLHGRTEGLADLDMSPNQQNTVDLSFLCRNADAGCRGPDGRNTPCPSLSGKSSNSACEINESFKCPEKDSAGEDCVESTFTDVDGEIVTGHLCKSSKDLSGILHAQHIPSQRIRVTLS